MIKILYRHYTSNGGYSVTVTVWWATDADVAIDTNTVISDNIVHCTKDTGWVTGVFRRAIKELTV